MSFILSKILWALLSPADLLVLLLLIGAFLAMSHRPKVQQFGHALNLLTAFTLFFIAIFPVGNWALAPLEGRFPPQIPTTVDGIILLGGDESAHMTEARGQPTAYDSASRHIEFATLARQYPDAKLIFTGGTGYIHPRSHTKDAEVAKRELTMLGVPTDQMLFEDQSRNTYENATMTAALVHPTPQQKYLLVTSAWHMPRAIATFRKAGWDVYAAPTNYKSDGEYSAILNFNLIEHLSHLSLAVHEYYGLLAYWLMGRSSALWPQ